MTESHLPKQERAPAALPLGERGEGRRPAAFVETRHIGLSASNMKKRKSGDAPLSRTGLCKFKPLTWDFLHIKFW